jgi:hypothetical protein
METWQSFNDNVLAKLMTMTSNVHKVFESECRVLTSYSYHDQKRFFPVRIQSDPTIAGGEPRESFPSDIGWGLTGEDFSRNDLRLREDNYSRSIVATDR